MQYKIPQNISIEDKIVGPLTLRQLIILAIGFGISYVLFAILSKLYELNILEYIIILIPALFAAAVALIKINNLRLSKFIILFLEFAIKPKRRMWDHRGISSIVLPDLSEDQAEPEKAADEAVEMEEKAKKAANLKDLSQVLDSGGFEHLDQIEHGDIDDSHDDDLVTQAYFGHKESKTENMYWRTKEAHKKMLDHLAQLPVTQLKTGTKETEVVKQAIAQVKQETEDLKKQKQASVATTPAKKKTRKRNRSISQPVRSNNQINTTQKNQPAEYISKDKATPAVPPAKPQEQTKASAKPAAEPAVAGEGMESASGGEGMEASLKSGELHFEELKDGEIEINLD